MVVIFNIYAIGQLLVAALVAGVLHLIMMLFGLEMIGGSREAFVTLLVIAAVSAVTDVTGMKGRLFFIPVWIVALLVAIVACYEAHDSLFAFTFLYLGIGGVILLYNRTGRLHYRNTWAAKKMALEQLKQEMAAGNVNSFWQMASHVYYNPGIFYLYFYSIWKFLYADAISQNEFKLYYHEFFQLIPENFDYTDYPAVVQMKEKVAEGLNHGSYYHPSAALQHLANAIDKQNGASRW